MAVPKIVFLSGGNGSHVIHPYGGLFDVTIISPTADSGGSSGELVRQNNTVPMGDMRRALLNGVPASRRRPIQRMFEHRFKNKAFESHTIGNIIIAGLLETIPDPNRAMDEMARIFGVHNNWRVRPATLTPIHLEATLSDGTTTTSEGELDARIQHAHVVDAKISPGDVPANPEAVEAIMDADIVIMGPTDHVTSLLAILMVPGIAQAMRETKAKRIYVANLMTKPNETHGYTLANYVCDIHRYAGDIVDHVIVNSGTVPDELNVRYLEQGQQLVLPDERMDSWDRPESIVKADLLMRLSEDEMDTKFVRHDPFRLLSEIAALYPRLRKHMYGMSDNN